MCAALLLAFSVLCTNGAEITYNIGLAWSHPNAANVTFSLYVSTNSPATNFTRWMTNIPSLSATLTNLPINRENSIYATAVDKASGLESAQSATVTHRLDSPVPPFAITIGTNVVINIK